MPIAFNVSIVLARLVRCISGTLVDNISSRYARSVYNLQSSNLNKKHLLNWCLNLHNINNSNNNNQQKTQYFIENSIAEDSFGGLQDW